MKFLAFVSAAFLAIGLCAGTPGSFAGVIVNGPDTSGLWIYVEGHNHSIRRVYVHDARIHCDSAVPTSEEIYPANLASGTRVRVIAEQDATGEWRASEVEILSGNTDEKKLPNATTSPPPNTSKEQ